MHSSRLQTFVAARGPFRGLPAVTMPCWGCLQCWSGLRPHRCCFVELVVLRGGWCWCGADAPGHIEDSPVSFTLARWLIDTYRDACVLLPLYISSTLFACAGSAWVYTTVLRRVLVPAFAARIAELAIGARPASLLHVDLMGDRLDMGGPAVVGDALDARLDLASVVDLASFWDRADHQRLGHTVCVLARVAAVPEVVHGACP
jgi:hypothetical protein